MEKTKLAAFVIVGLFVLFLIVAWSSSPPAEDSANDADQERELKISAEQAIKGGVPSIRLKNIGEHDWSVCEADINERFSMKFAVFAASGEQLIPHSSFTDDDGQRFNIQTHAVNELGVTCTEPEIGVWVGSVNR